MNKGRAAPMGLWMAPLAGELAEPRVSLCSSAAMGKVARATARPAATGASQGDPASQGVKPQASRAAHSAARPSTRPAAQGSGMRNRAAHGGAAAGAVRGADGDGWVDMGRKNFTPYSTTSEPN